MVGTLVRDARRRKRLTQVALAERAGLSQNYISKLESGTIDLPQRGTLEALSGALGLSVGDFYRAAGLMDDVGPETPHPRQLTLPSLDGEEEYDADEIVRYVESRPGQRFQEQLREAREARSYADYVTFCIRIFRAWESNSDLGLEGFRFGRGPGNNGL